MLCFTWAYIVHKNVDWRPGLVEGGEPVLAAKAAAQLVQWEYTPDVSAVPCVLACLALEVCPCLCPNWHGHIRNVSLVSVAGRHISSS